MNVLILGATGMIGRGILDGCLEDEALTKVVVIGRRTLGIDHKKLDERIVESLDDFEYKKHSAKSTWCLYCVGVSSIGMSEAWYHEVTHDLAERVVLKLREANPSMRFLFISGEGADRTLKSKLMWARVKGKIENTLVTLLGDDLYIMRPGVVVPVGNSKPRGWLYGLLTGVLLFLYPALKWIFPSRVTDTERMGRAAVALMRRGWDRQTLFAQDINALCEKR